MSIIKTEHLTHIYSQGTPYERAALQDFNIEIEEGEFAGIIGHTGSGKSTFIQHLNGLLPPTEGKVYIDGEDLWADKKDLRRFRFKVGLVFQYPEYQLFEADIFTDVCFGPKNLGFPQEEVEKRARHALKLVGMDEKFYKQSPFELSGGQKMRVALAGALCRKSDVLLFDEPTNHMDMRSKDILKNAIMKYDGTVIVVSHDREFLDGMVSKVYEFRNGGVREYLGGIYYFLEKRKLESLQEVERKDAPAKEAAPKASSSGKLTYEQKKEQEKLLRKLRKAVETIEASLADLEKKIADYDRKFAEATQYNEADYKAYNELKAEYDHQMHEWEKASYELEITEGE